MPGKLQGRLPRTVIENNAGEVITTEKSVFRLVDSPMKILKFDLFQSDSLTKMV